MRQAVVPRPNVVVERAYVDCHLVEVDRHGAAVVEADGAVVAAAVALENDIRRGLPGEGKDGASRSEAVRISHIDRQRVRLGDELRGLEHEEERTAPTLGGIEC